MGIYRPPKQSNSANNAKFISGAMGTAATAAPVAAGAIGGGIAAAGAGASVIGGVAGGAMVGATVGTGLAATGAATAAGVTGTLATGAAASAATGIGIPIAIALGVAAAGTWAYSAIKGANDKKEANLAKHNYDLQQEGIKSQQQGAQNVLNEQRGSYHQQGISSSLNAIQELSNPTGINNNRLI